MTESEARRVLLLQAVETRADDPHWSADDAAWATRAAVHDGATAPAERFVVVRARHALERLLARDAGARRWLERRGWRPLWAALAAGAAFVVGAAVDHVGAQQRIDLLAPPVWAVVAWNLAVYAALALPRRAHRLRRLLARRAAGDGAVALLWAKHAAPLAGARAAFVLHVAAAALACGLGAGMYLRGLVLDYRAGWQSTFLAAPTVQSLLDALLAPASAVTGIAVPDVAPLRLAPGAAPAASAAPWIHLYATTLALAVVLPRAALAVLAALRARAFSRRFPLALDGPYFGRLLRQAAGGRAGVDVLPHAAAPAAHAEAGLRRLLARELGTELDLHVAAPTAFGDEEGAAAIAPAAGARLRIALFDFGAMPEDEAQGRFVDALRGPLPLLALADEAAFRQRFGALPERCAERRAAWERLADRHGVLVCCTDLGAPAVDPGAAAAVQQALARWSA